MTVQWPLFKKKAAPEAAPVELMVEECKAKEPKVEDLKVEDPSGIISITPMFFHEPSSQTLAHPTEAPATVFPSLWEGQASHEPLQTIELPAFEPEREAAPSEWATYSLEDEEVPVLSLSDEETVAAYPPRTEASEPPVLSLGNWSEASLSPVLETDFNTPFEAPPEEPSVWLESSANGMEAESASEDSWMVVPAMAPDASIADLSMTYLTPESLPAEPIFTMEGEGVLQPLELAAVPETDMLSTFSPNSSLSEDGTLDFSWQNTDPGEVSEPTSLVHEASLGEAGAFMFLEPSPLQEEEEETLPLEALDTSLSSVAEESCDVPDPGERPVVLEESTFVFPAEGLPMAGAMASGCVSYADALEAWQRGTLVAEVHFMQNSINHLVNQYFRAQALEKR